MRRRYLVLSSVVACLTLFLVRANADSRHATGVPGTLRYALSFNHLDLTGAPTQNLDRQITSAGWGENRRHFSHTADARFLLDRRGSTDRCDHCGVAGGPEQRFFLVTLEV